jgi:hypothetical protein
LNDSSSTPWISKNADPTRIKPFCSRYLCLHAIPHLQILIKPSGWSDSFGMCTHLTIYPWQSTIYFSELTKPNLISLMGKFVRPEWQYLMCTVSLKVMNYMVPKQNRQLVEFEWNFAELFDYIFTDTPRKYPPQPFFSHKTDVPSAVEYA